VCVGGGVFWVEVFGGCGFVGVWGCGLVFGVVVVSWGGGVCLFVVFGAVFVVGGCVVIYVGGLTKCLFGGGGLLIWFVWGNVFVFVCGWGGWVGVFWLGCVLWFVCVCGGVFFCGLFRGCGFGGCLAWVIFCVFVGVFFVGVGLWVGLFCWWGFGFVFVGLVWWLGVLWGGGREWVFWGLLFEGWWGGVVVLGWCCFRRKVRFGGFCFGLGVFGGLGFVCCLFLFCVGWGVWRVFVFSVGCCWLGGLGGLF